MFAFVASDQQFWENFIPLEEKKQVLAVSRV